MQSRSFSVHVFGWGHFETSPKFLFSEDFGQNWTPQRGPKVAFLTHFWVKKWLLWSLEFLREFPFRTRFGRENPWGDLSKKSSKKRIFGQIGPPEGSKSGLLSQNWLKRGSRGAKDSPRNPFSVCVMRPRSFCEKISQKRWNSRWIPSQSLSWNETLAGQPKIHQKCGFLRVSSWLKLEKLEFRAKSPEPRNADETRIWSSLSSPKNWQIWAKFDNSLGKIENFSLILTQGSKYLQKSTL